NFYGLHTESATGLGTTPAYITVTDCHNLLFEGWNTSGATPTAGNLMTVAQTATNATHDVKISNSRFFAGTNVISSSVTGMPNLPFVAQGDTAMSVDSWTGLCLSPVRGFECFNTPTSCAVTGAGATGTCTVVNGSIDGVGYLEINAAGAAPAA